MIVAGIGLRPSASRAEIAALVGRAAHLAGLSPTLLAVPEFRMGPAALAAATEMGLPLRVVPQQAMRAVQAACPTRSMRAAAAVGLASVAEAAALAAAGPASRLLLPRIASASVTCALARAAGPDPAGAMEEWAVHAGNRDR